MSILVLNTGSSSLKFALFEAETLEVSASGEVEWRGDGRPATLAFRPGAGPERRTEVDAADPGAAATLAIRAASEHREVAAIGQRVVHGGPRFREGVRVDEAVVAEIDRLADLAPLHNPLALASIRAATAERPGVPQVAVFDTAFFAGLPRSASTYPVPHAWAEDWGIRRFGFHGISHAYCVGRAAEVLRRDPSTLRVVVCHLGNGCSASASRGGVAVDTTMGFTPLDGLMMGTRSGSVDPGILLHLLRKGMLDFDGLDRALNHASGLLGVSGVSGDFREVEAAAGRGDDRARLALEVYAARVKSAIGGLAATLGGLDALAFTAGVGEHSPTLRASATDGLRFLGLALDPDRNASPPPDSDVAADDSPARILVLHTREELMIAREVRKLLSLA